MNNEHFPAIATPLREVRKGGRGITDLDIKDINLPLQIGVQCPCLTAIQQDSDHQRLEDSNLCTDNARYSC